MSALSASLAPYTLPITLAMVTFLVLFIVYCVMYYDDQKKIKAPVPEWAVTPIAATATLTAAQVLNDVIVTSGSSAITLTFPTAAAIVAAVRTVKTPKVDMTVRLVIVNRSSATTTLAAGTGVTIDHLTILTIDYAVYSVTLTDVGGGSEAVSVVRLSTGDL